MSATYNPLKGSLLLDFNDPASGPIYGPVVFSGGEWVPEATTPTAPPGNAEGSYEVLPDSEAMQGQSEAGNLRPPSGFTDYVPLLLVAGVALFMLVSNRK